VSVKSNPDFYIYCARGEMENRIKACRLDLFADRTSTSTMRANRLRLYFASPAYVLLESLRRLAVQATDLADAGCGTIRRKLFKIAARVTIGVRRSKLARASGCPYAAIFAAAHRALAAKADRLRRGRRAGITAFCPATPRHARLHPYPVPPRTPASLLASPDAKVPVEPGNGVAPRRFSASSRQPTKPSVRYPG